MINQWLQITESLFQLCYLTFDFRSGIGSGFGSDVPQTRCQRWFKNITIAHHHSSPSVVSVCTHKQTSALQPYPENNLIISCFAMLGLLLLCQMWDIQLGLFYCINFPHGCDFGLTHLSMIFWSFCIWCVVVRCADSCPLLGKMCCCVIQFISSLYIVWLQESAVLKCCSTATEILIMSW